MSLPAPAVEDADVQYLLTSLRGSNEKVRRDAVRDLLAMGTNCVEPVLTVLPDPDPRTRITVIELLSRTGDPRAVPPLMEVLASDSDLNVRALAATALGRLRSPLALELLVRTASSAERDPRVRTHAIKALGELGDTRAVIFLVEMMGEEFDPPFMDAAADSLAKITGQKFGVDPRRWMQWIRANHPEWLKGTEGAASVGMVVIIVASVIVLLLVIGVLWLIGFGRS